MKGHIQSFGSGLGAGAALTTIIALTCLWRPGLLRGWLTGETTITRTRRTLERASDRARLAPGYVDAVRAAGL